MKVCCEFQHRKHWNDRGLDRKSRIFIPGERVWVRIFGDLPISPGLAQLCRPERQPVSAARPGQLCLVTQGPFMPNKPPTPRLFDNTSDWFPINRSWQFEPGRPIFMGRCRRMRSKPPVAHTFVATLILGPRKLTLAYRRAHHAGGTEHVGVSPWLGTLTRAV